MHPPSDPVLGIETSCDETAAALLAPDGTVLASALFSQEDHAAYGGVVPELAARAHLLHLPRLVRRVLDEASAGWDDLGGVAATTGPGLIGGLLVGAGYAKGVAIAAGKRFVAVNHLEAHALTPRLPGLDPEGAPFPYLVLLVSGGHCQFVLAEDVGQYRKLGGTVDDAVGEAFDKVAKLLGLGWPGGPALERLAAGGDPAGVDLPRPMRGRPGCDFSFSGLKTAVATAVARFPESGALPRQAAADLAASFQRAVVDILTDRTANALALTGAERLVVSGGVAANASVRTALGAVASRHGARLIAPPLRLCGDNAVMVAWAGIERLRRGLHDPVETPPRPRWPLESLRANAAA